MNRTLKEATVRRYHYETHRQLREHLEAFLNAYNFAKRHKTLRGLTPYEHICKAWADQPSRFRYDPTHLTSRLPLTRKEASSRASLCFVGQGGRGRPLGGVSFSPSFGLRSPFEESHRSWPVAPGLEVRRVAHLESEGREPLASPPLPRLQDVRRPAIARRLRAGPRIGA